MPNETFFFVGLWNAIERFPYKNEHFSEICSRMPFPLFKFIDSRNRVCTYSELHLLAGRSFEFNHLSRISVHYDAQSHSHRPTIEKEGFFRRCQQHSIFFRNYQKFTRKLCAFLLRFIRIELNCWKFCFFYVEAQMISLFSLEFSHFVFLLFCYFARHLSCRKTVQSVEIHLHHIILCGTNSA